MVLRSSLVAQWVKDPMLSLLWCEFDPWPGNFHMPLAQPKTPNQIKPNKTIFKKVVLALCVRFCGITDPFKHTGFTHKKKLFLQHAWHVEVLRAVIESVPQL